MKEHGGDRKTDQVDNVNLNSDKPKGGNGQEYLIRRLKRDAPEGNQNASKDKNNADNVSIDSERRFGNSKDYLLRRLARDHPDILDQLEAGEFASVRQAAIAAGIIKVKSPLEKALDAGEGIDAGFTG